MNKTIILTIFLSVFVGCQKEPKNENNHSKKTNANSNTIVTKHPKTEKKLESTLTESIDSVLKNGSYSYIVEPNGRIDTALMFINDYNTITSNLELNDIKEWVISQKNVTINFKKAYQKIYNDALKMDPELGLESDPILNAQDSPESGFSFKKAENEYVIVKGEGVDMNHFKVTLKVIKIAEKFYIDGCGIVNISKDKISKQD